MQIVATEFGDDAVERLEKFVLACENQNPEGDADVAFGNKFVGRRGRDHGGVGGTSAGGAIALAMITASMGLHFDFEDVAIGAAWNFHQRLTTIGTALLIRRQGDVFVFGGQMIVMASAMPLAA